MPLREWDPKGIEGRIELLQGLVKKSLRDPEISRGLALAVTRACPWRDDRCELQAIWYFMQKNIRYTGDIYGADTFQSARRTLDFGGGDCFPLDTKIVVRKRGETRFELRTLEELCETHLGYEALSYNFLKSSYEFKSIVGFVDKGEKPVLVARQDTAGNDIVATEDHKFWEITEGKDPKIEAKSFGELFEKFVYRGAVRIAASFAVVKIMNSGMDPSYLWMSPMERAKSGGGDSLENVTGLASRHIFSMTKALEPSHVGCITVEDNHNFFLSDGTLASNCDDGMTLIATLAMGNGFPAKGRITSNPGNPSRWAHIYPLVGVPKNNPRQWIPLDWTLGYNKFGSHPPQAKFVEFDGHQISHGREISVHDFAGW